MSTRTRCSASADSGSRAARGAEDLLGAEPLARAAEELHDERLERAASLERDLAIVHPEGVSERVDHQRRALASRASSERRTRFTPFGVVT